MFNRVDKIKIIFPLKLKFISVFEDTHDRTKDFDNSYTRKFVINYFNFSKGDQNQNLNYFENEPLFSLINDDGTLKIRKDSNNSLFDITNDCNLLKQIVEIKCNMNFNQKLIKSYKYNKTIDVNSNDFMYIITK
jgi:hypothetical protein